METTTLIFPSGKGEIEYTKEEVLRVLEFLSIDEFNGTNFEKPTFQEMPHGIFISTPGESLSNPRLENNIYIHVQAACYEMFGDCGCGEFEGSEDGPCDDIFCDEKDATEDPEVDSVALAEALNNVLQAIAEQEKQDAACHACDDEEDEALTGEYGLYNPDTEIASHSFIEEIDHVELFTQDGWYERDISWCDEAYAFIKECINSRLPEGFWVDDDFIVNYHVFDNELFTRAEVKMIFVAAIWSALRLDRAAYYLGLKVDAYFKDKA
jgi:hypothetical protein